MIIKPLAAISESDLAALKQEQRMEDRYIEYKSRLPDNASPAELERNRIAWLWKPITSFANTDGGDLVIGITANGGIPNLIDGVQVVDADRTKLEIENLVKSGIEPRVRLAGIQPVRLASGNVAFVIRVQRSWSGPHRVRANREFYYRTSAGVLEMDVATLRREFLLADTLIQRIRDFRQQRLFAIAATAPAPPPYSSPRTPVPIPDGARTVLHVVPVESIANPSSLTLPQMRSIADVFERVLKIRGGNVWSRTNFDGLVIASGAQADPARAYIQIYRNGILEFVRVYGKEFTHAVARLVPARDNERGVLRVLQDGIAALRQQDIGVPFIVGLALLDAKDYTYGKDSTPPTPSSGVNFDSNSLVAPEVIIADEAETIDKKMRESFDMLWNQIDVDASPHYSDDGRWLG